VRDLLFVDTETGGLDPNENALLQVGMVHWRDGRVLDSREIQVHASGLRVEPQALRVNHIQLADHNATALSRQTASHEIERWVRDEFNPNRLEKVTIAGHNVAFDVAFLKPLFGRRWFNLFTARTIDTSGLLAFFYQAGLIPVPLKSLDDAIAYFGVKLVSDGERHTALVDAMVTAEVYDSMLKLLTPRHALHRIVTMPEYQGCRSEGNAVEQCLRVVTRLATNPS
jgi:DNA polymerase III epsilon subunit-like protein